MRRRFLIAGVVATVLILGLTALQPMMALRLEAYVSSGEYIPLWERVLWGIALFWRTFWWLATPFILIVSFGIALLADLGLRKRG